MTERGLYDAFNGYLDAVLRSLAEIPEDWHDQGWLRTDLLPMIALHIVGASDGAIREELLARYRSLQEQLAVLAAAPRPSRH